MFSGLNKDEVKKLAAIELLKRDDDERDRTLADFALLASRMMGVSGCFVTIFDEHFQYIKFAVNIPNLSEKVPAEESMCIYSVATCSPTICPDTRLDPRFADHPHAQDGYVVFYASAPLKTKEGLALGALCVSEHFPVTPTDAQVEDFLHLAALASAYLESWYSLGRIDPLTGLPNRQRLLQEIERLPSGGNTDSHTLIIFDCIEIPKLYELSRYLGIKAIETMIHSFAPLLRSRLGLDYTVNLYAFATGRYAVLVTKEEAEVLLDKTRTLPTTSARINDDIEIELKIFAGYVCFTPQEYSAQDILRQGVSALHEAIRETDRVREFDALLDQKRNYDSKLLYDLSDALKSHEQTYLVYQPKILLETGKTVGVEALLRWNHPKLGHISPAKVVALAQKTSLMTDITDWVVDEAIRQLVKWRAQGILIPVSINFTASDLSQVGLANRLEDKLLKAGLTTADIRIECLETEEIIASDTTLNELDMLKIRGFKILLDDFGAGYSNINYLRRIPIDIIKLDRSIVSGITTDTGSLIIAKNIITMLKELDYVVLAEGVEDRETATIVKNFGCDEAQGYFFSKPILPDELVRWLADRREVL